MTTRRRGTMFVTLPMAGLLAFGPTGSAHALDGVDVDAALEELDLEDLDGDVVDEIADIVEDAEPAEDDVTLDDAIEEWGYLAPEWRSIPDELAAQVQACRAADDDESDPPTDTTIPETSIPENTIPETTVPEPSSSEITAPESTLSESTIPESTIPETTTPDDDAAVIDDTEGCGQELQLRLRLNHVEQLSAHLDERLANAQGNPAALAAMERIQVRVLTRLGEFGELSAEDAAMLEELQVRVSEQVRNNAGGNGNGRANGNNGSDGDDDSTSDDTDTEEGLGDGTDVVSGRGNGNGNSKSDGDVDGPGNAGGNGNGNGNSKSDGDVDGPGNAGGNGNGNGNGRP